MKIDRYNYEEYFILYMDNELSSDERRGVELFVQNHPDLKEELDLLLQYKLIPDPAIVFTGKEDLIRVDGSIPVNLTNYEEWLVLYIDNELTAEQKIIIEQFIKENPSVKQELTLLQRSKLQPEQVVFADKNSLYRKEEKTPRIPVLWPRLRQAFGDRRWRVAAAVVILAIGLTTVIVLNTKPSGGKEDLVKIPGSEQKNTPVELTEQKNEQEPVAVITGQNTEKINPLTTDVTKTDINTPLYKQSNNPVATKDNKTIIDKMNVNTPVQIKKEESVIADNNNRPSNNLPVPLKNPATIKNDVPNNAVVSNNIPKEIITPKNALTNPGVTSQNPQSSDLVNASFSNTDDADFNQPGSKKGKLRGFFRKVTRTFEKRTSMDATEDDKFLVAGLAFKLK